MKSMHFSMVIMVQDKKEKEKKDKSEETLSRSALSQAYSSFEQDLVETQKKDKEKKKDILQKGIEEIEKESKSELLSSKNLVGKLLEIRQRAEMSSTIGTAGKIKTPIIFGKDEYKQKLAREILTIGTEELKAMGYAITVANFVEYFERTRPNWKIKTGEILQTIKELEKEKLIPPKVDLGEDEVLIRFKPIELSNDLEEVLQLATGLPGLKAEQVSSHLDWPFERSQSTLTMMSEMGLAVLDDETSVYYFPGIFKILE